MIDRDNYISLLEKWRDKKVVKVVTGIRRCGKSTLLKMYRERLLASGVSVRQTTSLNFEDIDNEQYLDYKVLYSYVKSRLLKEKTNYIFFDEIQMVGNFQRVIDSLLLLDNVDIYVTGSNAYLLSGEIATLLSGRYVEIRLFPLSFKEYVSAMPTGTSLDTAYRKYTELGAFPYTTQLGEDRELVRDYLMGVYNTIVLKDVVARNKIADVLMLESVVKFIADNIGNVSVPKRISDTLTSAGRKVSPHTVDSYIAALITAYIVYPAQRIDLKGMQFLKSGFKLYLADMGLRNVVVGTKTGDLGHILENVVFIELLRRGGEVYVGKAGNAEIDFVTVKDGMRTYYQVALSVRDASTLERELKPLLAQTDSFPKFLLTLDNDPVVYHNGIVQMYVIDWLLGGNDKG